jgi:hypothetical protein
MYALITCYGKFFLLHYTQVLRQYRLYKADHAYLTYLMLQRHLSRDLWVWVKVRVTLRLAVYRQSVHLGVKLLETHDQRFFQLNPCSHSPYVISSLTRGWVCRLQLLLALASAVILGSESAGLMTIFYCPGLETPPTWRARSLYLYPPGTGWPSYNPRHWVPFSSPPTTCRAKVEVLEPASTLRFLKVKVTLWLISPSQGRYLYKE